MHTITCGLIRAHLASMKTKLSLVIVTLVVLANTNVSGENASLFSRVKRFLNDLLLAGLGVDDEDDDKKLCQYFHREGKKSKHQEKKEERDRMRSLMELMLNSLDPEKAAQIPAAIALGTGGLDAVDDLDLDDKLDDFGFLPPLAIVVNATNATQATTTATTQTTTKATTTPTTVATTTKAACPDKYVKVSENCYFFSGGLEPWKDAHKECNSSNTDLAHPESEAENTALIKFLKESKPTIYGWWLGGKSGGNPVKWKWEHNGKEISKPSWFGSADEYNTKAADNCLAYNNDYKWSAKKCAADTTLHFICQVKK